MPMSGRGRSTAASSSAARTPLPSRADRHTADARIHTARLVLRRPAPDDLDAYLEVEDEPAAERELYDALAHWRAHDFGPWLIEHDGRTVGILEVHYAGPGVKGIEPNEVEIGWSVVERERRHGFATEAGSAAVADAWRRTTAPWLVAYIRPENHTSQRVAERLGMRHVAEGLTRSGDPMQIYRVARPTTLPG